MDEYLNNLWESKEIQTCTSNCAYLDFQGQPTEYKYDRSISS